MENLYEHLYGDVKRMLSNKKRQMDISKVNLNKSDSDDETITTGSNYNNGKMYMDDEFCRKLISYLEREMDKSFPNHTKLKSVLSKEVKKVMKSGNEKEIKKVVEKIRDIILKERIKFMDNVEKRVLKILTSKY